MTNENLTAKTKSIALSTRRVVKERSTALQQTNRRHPGYGQHQQQSQQQGSNSQQSQPQSDSSSPWSNSAAAAGLSSSWLYNSNAAAEQYGATGEPSSSSSSATFKSPTTTEIECSVQNVFPLPELTIYQMDGQRPKSLENPRYAQNVTKLANGAFSVSVKAFIEDTELFPQTTAAAAVTAAATGANGANGRNSGSSGGIVGAASNQQSQLAPSTVFECLVSQEELRHELRKRTQYTLIGRFISLLSKYAYLTFFIF